MCGYFCTGFIDFMLKNKNLLDYTNLFSPYDCEKANENTVGLIENISLFKKIRLQKT